MARASILRARLGRAVHSNILISEVTVSRGFAISRLRWDARFNSLLELAEACSVPVRWSCRTGVCHNCESGLIDGRLRYSPEPIDPSAEGIALICCSSPVSDIELDL